MVKQTKALQAIQNFANRRSAMYKVYTGRINALNLPRGFTADYNIKIEKDGRPVILVSVTSEKFYITKISADEIADAYLVELTNELRNRGIKPA